MTDPWLQTRLNVLGAYIKALLAGQCDNPQRFVWEDEVPAHWTRPAYHAAILIEARRSGLDVTDDKVGFSIALPI
jgi:hypothetical protein